MVVHNGFDYLYLRNGKEKITDAFGQNSPAGGSLTELFEIADVANELKEIMHYCTKCVLARKGIKF